MKSSDRLQGTDGVRGVAHPSSDPQVSGLSPLQAFRDRGVLTEQFVELYAYAHVLDLRRKGKLIPSGEVVVGWDPRDPEGLFTAAAVRGLRKGGARAIVVGILPTPAVVLYLLYRRAASALVITASHNPADQNGVKLFLGPLGLKPFPADDRSLTELVCSLNFRALDALTEVGGREEARAEALRVFRDFSWDPHNHWIEDPTMLRDLLIVVDPAWGAFSGIAAPVFRELGAAEVIEVNDAPGKSVNRDSGVAELEGTDQIDGDLRSPAGTDFSNNAALRELFRLGRRHRAACTSGQRRVAAAVFDADGDRFYPVLYDPFDDRALILSGDESAFHQARYLVDRFPSCYRGAWYLNTVESDLNASRAASHLGYRTGLTGVGDKWLLRRAWLSRLSAQLESLKNHRAWAELESRLTDLSDPARADAFALGELAGAIERMTPEKADSAAADFGVANEESGHLLTTGQLTLEGGRSTPVFIGNGLKGALNTLVALRFRAGGAASGEGLRRLHHPFPPGFKQTLYVYYTDKAQLLPGAEVRQALEGMLEGACREALRENEALSLCPFPEEPEMLYQGMFVEGEQRAGVFARNSGTEEKTAIYLRGAEEDEGRLTELGEKVSRFLLARMKNPESPFARAERSLLWKLRERPAGLSEEELRGSSLELPFSRLAKEMERQGLVARSGPLWRLTSLGEWLLST